MVQSIEKVATEQPTPSERRRVIKRYSNRKLYDTRDSRYVTLQQIGEMVRGGDDVQIIDNKTKEDKTEVTLALILSEDLKSKPATVPLGTLRNLIQERGERLLSSLREGPIGRLIPGGDDAPPAHSVGGPQGAHSVGSFGPQGARSVGSFGPQGAQTAEPGADSTTDQSPPEGEEKKSRGRIEEIVVGYRHAVEQLQSSLDERVAAIVPGVAAIRELRGQVARLARRIDALERHLGLEDPTRDENR